jgi:hypothetical protein
VETPAASLPAKKVRRLHPHKDQKEPTRQLGRGDSRNPRHLLPKAPKVSREIFTRAFGTRERNSNGNKEKSRKKGHKE